MTIGEDAPVSGETLYISAEKALALVAFGDSLALTGFMHEHPQLWPRAAELFEHYGIASTDFESHGCRKLAGPHRDKLDDDGFLKLCDRLHAAYQEWTDREERLLAASGLLCEAAATGKLTMSGRRGSYRTRQIQWHRETLPALFFLTEGRSITPDGWTAFLPSAPPDVLTKWREDASASPDYGDLRFRRDEILALIGTQQPTPAGTAQPATMDDEESGPSKPRIELIEAAPATGDPALEAAVRAAPTIPWASIAMDGSLFLDIAIDRIKEWLACPDDAAAHALLDALRQGKFLASQTMLLAPRIIRPTDWQDAIIKPALFKEPNAGGVFVMGSNYHPRWFRLAEDGFVYWLERQTPEAPARPTAWPRQAPTDRRDICEREFIGFDDIANSCPINPSDLRIGEKPTTWPLTRLRDDFRRGFFSQFGKSVVVARANRGRYPDPTITWEEFDASPGIARDDEQRFRLLRDLEVPRAYALRWFQAHGLVPPVGWFTEAEMASAASAGPSGGSQAPAPPTLSNATDQQIREAIEAIYSHAERHEMKPPNIKELPAFVLDLLSRQGKRAGRPKVTKIGEDFSDRRRKPGIRVNDSLPAFSLEGCGKSGSES